MAAKKAKRSIQPMNYLLGAVGFVLMFWMVTGGMSSGWIYDLFAGTGNKPGQRPDASVIELRTSEQVKQAATENLPATARGTRFVNTNTYLLRDPDMAGTRTTGRRGGRRQITTEPIISHEGTLPQRIFHEIGQAGSYLPYQLMELSDGSYLCVIFDDYLLAQGLFGGEVQLPAGVVRAVSGRELQWMQQMDTDLPLEQAYILDCYNYEKRPYWVDMGLRFLLFVCLLFVWFLAADQIAKLWRRRQKQRQAAERMD